MGKNNKNNNNKPKIDNTQSGPKMNTNTNTNIGIANSVDQVCNTTPSTNMTELLGQSRDILYEQQQQQQFQQHQQQQQRQQQQQQQIYNRDNHQQMLAGQETPGVQHEQSTFMYNRDYQNMGQYQGQYSATQQNPVIGTQHPQSQIQLSNMPPQGQPQNVQGSCDIPNWAITLCQQMTNIQNALETQTNRWRSVETNTAIQNDKLVKVQNQLSKITQIKENIASTSRRVTKCEDEMKTMHAKVNEYETSVQQYSDICDGITYENTDFDKRLKKLEHKMNTIEQEKVETYRKIEKVDDRVTDIQWRSMRENLLFLGIPEAPNFQTNGENCEEVIQNFLKEELDINRNIPIDRAHRLGRYRNSNQRPRPIVVKFTFYKDKENTKEIAQQKLRNDDSIYWVKDQYPREIEEKRRQLYSKADEARQDKTNRVKLVRDKLFINGEQYIPETRTPTQVQTRNDSSQTRRYIQSNSRRNDGTRIDENTNARQSYEKQKITNDNMQWSRTYYRRPRPVIQNVNTVDFKTTNRYTELGQDTPVNAETKRDNQTRKKKAVSPLEDVVMFKKQHIDSDNETESNESTILFGNELSDSQQSTQAPALVLTQNDTEVPVDDLSQTHTRAPVPDTKHKVTEVIDDVTIDKMDIMAVDEDCETGDTISGTSQA